jgi:hypothetical protein
MSSHNFPCLDINLVKTYWFAMHKAADGNALGFVGAEAVDWIFPSCGCSLIYI